MPRGPCAGHRGRPTSEVHALSTHGATVRARPHRPFADRRIFIVALLLALIGPVAAWANAPIARGSVDPGPGAAYVPIAPHRTLDSRSGTGLAGTFKSGLPRSFTVAGEGGVPANAIAVTGNLTVVGQTSAGYVSLGPVETDSPTTSTLNFPKGDIRANGVTVPLGPGGILAATFMGTYGSSTTHLVFDVTGYFLAEPSAGSAYVPINPERALDSRSGTGLAGVFGSGDARSFVIAGEGGVPANAIAVTGNLTVVGQTSAGYVSLGPVETDSPTTSTLNFPKGDIRANGVTVPLGPGGILAATFMGTYGSSTTHLVFDVTGYFVEDTSAGALFVTMDPARVVDSRNGTGLGSRLVSGEPRTFQVDDIGQIPADAVAVTGNLTAVGQTAAGYVSLGPIRTYAPETSTLNVPLGDIRANGVTVPLSADGRLAAIFKGPAGATNHLVFDATGYFVGGPPLTWLPEPDDPDAVATPEGVTRIDASVRFAGAGYGHGVGLSQYGAQGRALAGQSAAEILGHYYQGTALGSLDPSTQIRVLVLSGWKPTESSPLRIVGRGSSWTMDGSPASFPADATLSVRPPLSGTTAWRYRVTASSGTTLSDTTATGGVRIYPGAVGRLELPTKPTSYDEFRGVLRVIPSTSTVSVVNELGIEAYLGGVVPAEMPSSWHAEALRAQAIAARSYAAYRLHPATGSFDVYDDTRSQVYRGLLGEKTSTNAAIADTAGIVVTSSGSIANTLFHSTGGGATEHNENAFVSSTGGKVAGPLSYLRGSPDTDPGGTAYDAASPWAGWQTATYSRATISAWFAADPRTEVGTIVGLDLRDRGVSGRLISVTLYGTDGTARVSGDVFRAIFNAGLSAGAATLRGNAFYVVGAG